MTATPRELEERIARLEAQQNLATKADLAAVRLEISRDIANLATGIGDDLRAMRQDMGGLHDDLRAIRQELAGIRELLTRSAFRWPWEKRS